MANVIFDGTSNFKKDEIKELEEISIQQLPGRKPRETQTGNSLI